MTPEDIKKARDVIVSVLWGEWIPRTLLKQTGTFYATGPERELIVYAKKDAEFIAAARTGWPEALDEVERLRDQRDMLAATVDRMQINLKELNARMDEIEQLNLILAAYRKDREQLIATLKDQKNESS